MYFFSTAASTTASASGHSCRRIRQSIKMRKASAVGVADKAKTLIAGELIYFAGMHFSSLENKKPRPASANCALPIVYDAFVAPATATPFRDH